MVAMLVEKYPQETWTPAYTYGSATDVIQKWRSGGIPPIPQETQADVAIPTGSHCTNHRAELEALMCAIVSAAKQAQIQR